VDGRPLAQCDRDCYHHHVVTNGAAKALADRVAAVRAELSETERLAANGATWAKAAVRALKRDLLKLETKLEEVTR
jgi:hypothetical protein